jgi:hypothetical protein
VLSKVSTNLLGEGGSGLFVEPPLVVQDMGAVAAEDVRVLQPAEVCWRPVRKPWNRSDVQETHHRSFARRGSAYDGTAIRPADRHYRSGAGVNRLPYFFGVLFQTGVGRPMGR